MPKRVPNEERLPRRGQRIEITIERDLNDSIRRKGIGRAYIRGDPLHVAVERLLVVLRAEITSRCQRGNGDDPRNNQLSE